MIAHSYNLLRLLLQQVLPWIMNFLELYVYKLKCGILNYVDICFKENDATKDVFVIEHQYCDEILRISSVCGILKDRNHSRSITVWIFLRKIFQATKRCEYDWWLVSVFFDAACREILPTSSMKRWMKLREVRFEHLLNGMRVISYRCKW